MLLGLEITLTVSVAFEYLNVVGRHEDQEEIEVCTQTSIAENSLIDVDVVLDKRKLIA